MNDDSLNVFVSERKIRGNSCMMQFFMLSIKHSTKELEEKSYSFFCRKQIMPFFHLLI